ncbi:unnamed protein product [Calypogeia fissa]
MLIARRKRRLPKVGCSVEVNMVCEDLGACEISLQISGCVISYVLIDGGSGVNIMIEATAHQLGFKKFEATSKSMRLANGTRVLPVGILTQIPTIIGGVKFLLNFLVMRPTRPSTYPILIGRPWLYGAQVKSDWGRKEFSFGNPMVKVPWEPVEYQGGMPLIGEDYDSNFTSAMESDEDEVYMLALASTLTEKEVFGDHVKSCCIIEEIGDESQVQEGSNKVNLEDEHISGIQEDAMLVKDGELEAQLGEAQAQATLEELHPLFFSEVKEAKAEIEPEISEGGDEPGLVLSLSFFEVDREEDSTILDEEPFLPISIVCYLCESNDHWTRCCSQQSTIEVGGKISYDHTKGDISLWLNSDQGLKEEEKEEERVSRHYCETLEGPPHIEKIFAKTTYTKMDSKILEPNSSGG